MNHLEESFPHDLWQYGVSSIKIAISRLNKIAFLCVSS